ncbi:MAG: hypothetical protein C7B45_04675 [Sulfobacillus acidophilus]|uniref:ChsH2 C-terminal OB-fold domain-containing protein n=1 Tax=Sulfobacillus acidophilus TaxID=53633 RepID=A0A2T2WL00_9FIRM|nr:MAG: hypothetical protein C7B45_04675 [Sulfobacillus acidophilus]
MEVEYLLSAILEDLRKGHAIPVVPNVFAMGVDGSLRLAGSECQKCQWRTFPRVKRCLRCHSGNIGDVLLIPQGIVDSFTVVRQGPLEWTGLVPYVLVRVLLEDGVQVVSHLRECLTEDIRIGMSVRGELAVLFEEEGRSVVGPVFVPA